MRNKGSLLLCVATLTVLVLGCACSDDVSVEAITPDEKRIATVFVRNCGATTDYVTHVAVNWRSSERNNDDIVFTLAGDNAVKVIWSDNNTLRIACKDCSESKIFKLVTKTGDIVVQLDR